MELKKKKKTYTGACHEVIQFFLDCQFPAKDEELFLHHQSPCVSLFVGVFEPDWEALLIAWVTRQQNDDIVVVVVKHACDRHAHL